MRQNVSFLWFLIITSAAFAQPFDLVIRNGAVRNTGTTRLEILEFELK